jgi:hypothetical protein
VCIVSAEDFQGTRNRILAEAVRLRLRGDERERLDARLRWAHVKPSATALSVRAAIERDIAGAELALIFVDTGPALFPGDDENDNIALRNFVESFQSMATLPGSPCTVLAWHPNKGATADRLEPRGASAIKGTCDFNLTLWREDDRLTISYTKMRAQHFDLIEGRLSSVELVAPSGARFSAPVIDLADEDDRPERSDTRLARERILRCLSTVRSPPTVRDVARATELSTSATGRHLQHLSTCKPALVEKDSVTDRYTLTAKGATRAKEIAAEGEQRFSYANDRE